MSSRRIGSFTNLSPIQEIAINPFSTFNSDSVNKLTRTLSNGKDGVCFGLDVRNSNGDNKIIDTFNLFRSGDTFVESEWNFDTEFTKILSGDNTKLDGVRLNSVTEYKNLTFTNIVDLEKYKLDKLVGNNIYTIFNFTFNISIGCPKRLIFFVNDSNVSIDYPKTKDGLITISVPHNIRYDEVSGIKLSCCVLMDPNDMDSRVSRDNVYNGESYFQIDNFHYSVNILNDKDIENVVYPRTISGSYSNYYIHPTETLYVTPGIAIKDDLMLDFKKNQQSKPESIKLDLNSNTSWIKNNPYDVSDFYLEGSEQKAYVYNNNNRTDPLILTGAVNDTTKKLNFWYNDITSESENPILLMDEYELSNYDEELDFTITSGETVFLFHIQEHTVTNEHKDLYGTVAYLVNKKTNKILNKFNLEYSNYKYSEQTIEFDIGDIKLDSEYINKDNLKIVACIGPIKVAGDITKYNTQMVKWGYVCVYYTYFKHPRPNKAYIGLLRETDLQDLKYKEDYVILAKVRFVSPNTVDIISYEDRQNIFTMFNEASNIDFSNQLTEEEKNLWINPKTGILEIPITVSDAILKLGDWLRNTDEFEQVQSDWTETDESSKAFIQHKPTIPAAQIQSDWNQTTETELDFIKNKPTIPAAQIQSDWTETDEESKAFILNKPTIPAEQVNSDWAETDENSKAYILNKPFIPEEFEHIQSDWQQTDTSQNDFIKNKPDIIALIKQYTKPDIGTLKFIAKPTLIEIDENSSNFDGWVYPDGRSLSRTDFEDAFNVFGTSYGTESDTTFKIPNLEHFIKLNPGKQYSVDLQNYNNPVPEHTHTGTINKDSATDILLKSRIYGTNTTAFKSEQGNVAGWNEKSAQFCAGAHHGTVYAKYSDDTKSKIILSFNQLTNSEYAVGTYLDSEYNGIPLYTSAKEDKSTSGTKIVPVDGFNIVNIKNILDKITGVTIDKTSIPSDPEPRPKHNIIPVLIYIGQKKVQESESESEETA